MKLTTQAHGVNTEITANASGSSDNLLMVMVQKVTHIFLRCLHEDSSTTDGCGVL